MPAPPPKPEHRRPKVRLPFILSTYFARRQNFDLSYCLRRRVGTGVLALLTTAWWLLIEGTPAFAQQCCPDTGPIKWVQTPDLFSNNTVNVSQGLTLADDFLCTNRGPVTDIHIWGGWLNDQVDPNAVFKLSIWSDVPATNGPVPIPSHPGELLWSQAFGPGQYSQCPYVTNGGPFFDPRVPGDIGAVSIVYYLCFNPTNPFVQLGTTAMPTNYWLALSVQTDPVTGMVFGWRDSLAAYNDTAVWVNGPPPPPGSWNELLGDAAIYNRPLDLAFKVITSTNQPPPTCCPEGTVKFVQRPDRLHGLDVNASQGLTLADDFLCTTPGPIADIHLWGGWLTDQIDPSVVFTLGIWSDVPATNGPVPIPSHPGQLLWSQAFGPGQYVQCLDGMGPTPFFEPRLPGIIGSETNLYYLCFYPTNAFVQQGTAAAPTNYWLSVSAQGAAGSTLQFGWRSSIDSYNDTAVWVNGTPPPPGTWNELIDPQNQPLNLAFKVNTSTNQPPPPTCVEQTNKFVQPPNIDAGYDVWDNGPWVLGDDFNCTTTGPITDIHIWSSWLNNLMDPNPTFWLAIYDDVPATNGPVPIPSHPGTLQWQQWFGPSQYTYLPAGNGSEQFLDPGPPAIMGFDSQAWYYCFNPTNPFVQLGTPGQPLIYWLVVYTQSPATSTNKFGWKSSTIQQNDVSVHAPWPGGPPPPTTAWQPTITPGGVPLDLAFKISTTTNQCPPPTLLCSNRVVECGTSWTLTPPPVFDQCCPSNVVVTPINIVTNGTCPEVITVTWQATDCRGLTATCTQTVTVVDTTPPVIICGPNKTVECGTTWTFDTPSAYDRCCTNVQVFVHDTVTNGTCPQYITRTWEALDCCSNASLCSQTVTVQDTTPPVIICGTNKVVPCGQPWTFDTPYAYDTCCSNVTVSILSTVTNGTCPQYITRTWVAYDCCGNRSACSQTVTVVNITPPVLTCPTNKTVECGTTWTFDPPSASSQCCSNVQVFVLSTVTNGVCPQYVIRTWEAVDCCGNTNTCSQTVTVVDTIPPVIICGTNKTVECGTTWTFDAPYAYDNCCTNVQVFVLSTVTNGMCPQYVVRTWEAVDCCGNTNTCSQTVTVVDTIPPVIICGTNKTVECGTTWTFDTPYAYDTCCSNVTVSVLSTVTNGTCPQYITRTWVAEDCCTNRSTCSQTVTVVNTTPPVLTCATNKTVECGTPWTFDPPSAFSQCCGSNVTVVVLYTVTNASGPCSQSVTRTWLAVDCCTNRSTCSQTVNIIDTTPPVINCASNKTVQCGSAWSFDPPTAYDTCCGSNVTVSVLGTVTNGVCPQFLTRTWEATDCCSNRSTCSQIVTVVDTIPPVIHCPSNIVVVTCQTNVVVTWTDSASDACSSNVTIVCTPPSGSTFARDTTNTVHCVATDACGNSSTCDFLVIVERPTLHLTIVRNGGLITLTWTTGVLQEADSLFGPWTDVPGAISPYTTTIGHPHRFYRLRCP